MIFLCLVTGCGGGGGGGGDANGEDKRLTRPIDIDLSGIVTQTEATKIYRTPNKEYRILTTRSDEQLLNAIYSGLTMAGEDTYYIKTTNNNQESQIINYSQDEIIHTGTLIKDIAAIDESLYFTENNKRICKYQTKQKILKCAVVNDILALELGKMVNVWKADIDGIKKISFDENLTKKLEELKNTPIILRTKKNKTIVYEITNFNKDFLWLTRSLSQIYGEQYGEPYSYDDNEFGRVAWNYAYRIEALALFIKYTKVKHLNKILNNAINAQLDILDENQNKCLKSKKYSVNKNVKTEWLVHDAKLYKALGIAGQYLEYSTELRIREFSKKCYMNWQVNFVDDRYMFQNDENIEFDGLPLPMNMQSAALLWMFEIIKHDHDAKIQENIDKLSGYIKKQLTQVENMMLWHYFPKEYYDGWDEAKYYSINKPTREPETPKTYDDFSHAAITLEALRKMGINIGERKILERSIITNEVFSKTMLGATGSIEEVPNLNWAEDEILQEYIKKYDSLKRQHFDNQDWFLTYVKLLENAQGPVGIIKLDGKIVAECNTNIADCANKISIAFERHMIK